MVPGYRSIEQQLEKTDQLNREDETISRPDVGSSGEGMGAGSVWERYERFFRAPPEVVFEWNDPESPARGWLVINSLKGGAAGGGTRMHVGLDREEVTFLAKAMELKFAFAGPSIGGAKSGIDFDPSDPRKGEVLKRWFRAILPELASRYGTAGDLNVSEIEEVIPCCREIGISHPQLGVLHGHLDLEGEALGRRSELMHIGLDQPVPDSLGLAGREARVFGLVTGHSVACAALRLLERQQRKPDETRVLLQGFGTVGGAAALYMARSGIQVVGITDATSALLRSEGLSAEDVESLLLSRSGNTLPATKDRLVGPESHAEFWKQPADMFVAAAGSGSLDAGRLDQLEAAGVTSIVSGANHPFWASEPGDTTLEQEADRRFAVIADVIASCGTAHAFACQARSDMPLRPEQVFDSIRGTVEAAVDEAIRRCGSAETGLLSGALELALDRCGPAAITEP
ncbi:MAG: amino acid dehydrogenase [marine benthic group bacterium]|jgi:glutamate dehydrogenase (NAD(P)+)|nr:amino acid dehydrogenase [Gemmatimonadota bacterium]MCL7963318.1 amino acid dehydrogenase [Candidatus Carthagonibacter metallireducens]MCL7938383.1 amino acid dehydrogenase [Gemmatimonadota bacterium]MCL7966592.1 amino acid dehydrogenase [Gemmatimonadota bacterium]MCL7969219.1 amino acid dehydrogenase [Gemmatimonadota bacterium]